MSCLAALGIGLAVCLFVFNLNYRNNMYVLTGSLPLQGVQRWMVLVVIFSYFDIRCFCFAVAIFDLVEAIFHIP